jgi:hypothetical protein
MPHRVEFHGSHAEVRWGYQVAAVLGGWTLRTEPGPNGAARRVLVGQIHSRHALALRQTPLMLIVPLAAKPGRTWRWPILELQCPTETTLTAVVGPREG